MVVNYVRGGSTKSTRSSTSSTSAVSGPGVTPPTSPAVLPVTSTPDWRAGVQQSRREDISAVYATVNKGGQSPSKPSTSATSKSSPPAADKAPTVHVPPGGARLQVATDDSGYSFVDFQDGATSACAGNARHVGSSSSSESNPYSLSKRVHKDSDPYSLAEEVAHGPTASVPVVRSPASSGGGVIPSAKIRSQKSLDNQQPLNLMFLLLQPKSADSRGPIFTRDDTKQD
ncbi:hypothetical protein ElyMa_000738400 [Elysia marginata]|uniref:Uncharacterized protein n=1 Tax=Elysia marginata TaxID=1093978 RepID=A0AAV4GP97_9GAST|nr:hypothetical protein ElyMa_000738400 [Elysia marginata]